MGDEDWEFRSFADFVEQMHSFRQTVLKWPKNCSTAIECQMQLVALRREQEEKEAEDKINEEKQWEMVNKADRIMSQVLKAT